MKFEMPREQFYEEVQKTAAGLSSERQTELKGLVDWLEDYERGEEALGSADRQGRAEGHGAGPRNRPQMGRRLRHRPRSRLMRSQAALMRATFSLARAMNS